MRTGSSSGRHARREEREGREGEGREKRKREKHWKREKEKKGKVEKKKREGGRIRIAIVAPVGHARRRSRARGQARRVGRGAQRDVTAGFRVKASSFGESGDRAGK